MEDGCQSHEEATDKDQGPFRETGKNTEETTVMKTSCFDSRHMLERHQGKSLTICFPTGFFEVNVSPSFGGYTLHKIKFSHLKCTTDEFW